MYVSFLFPAIRSDTKIYILANVKLQGFTRKRGEAAESKKFIIRSKN